MIFIDSHAHIYSEQFSNDIDVVIKSAAEQGVARILMPAIDASTHKSMLQIVDAYPSTCIPMIGIHPCSVKENYIDELAEVERLLASTHFCAIGEIGLDFYWDTSFAAQQYTAFNRQIEIALQHNLPIVIHSRNSLDESLTVVEQYVHKGLRGVFHCFSGTIEQVERVVATGFYMGIGGVLTYKKSGLEELVKHIDINKILLETDAPYLTPVPYRGKRNKPSYIPIIAAKLAQAKGLTIEELARVTTQNNIDLFGIEL